MPIRVVLADDSPAVRDVLVQILDRAPDIDVDVVAVADDEPSLLAAAGDKPGDHEPPQQRLYLRPDLHQQGSFRPGGHGIARPVRWSSAA